MAEYLANVVVAGDPAEHPAARAWRSADPRRRAPASIFILKEPWPGRWGKSAVYRLEKAGPRGANVIAKRSAVATAALERTIYEEILPRLPVSALEYHGCVEEPGGRRWWHFLEEATGEPYWPKVDTHRAAAARWLALLHTAASRLDGEPLLPPRGPAHYLDMLRDARRGIASGFENPALGVEDAPLLAEIADHLDAVEARWADVARLADGFPSTLVHGDFVTQNVRMRSGPDGPAPLPFDWESAGWGVPAADLELLDLDPYWGIARESWPALDRPALETLKKVGILFRCVASIDWATTSLSGSQLDRPLGQLRVYLPRLAAVTRDLGWGE